METKLGKIESASFGNIDGRIGINIALKGLGWGVCDFKGYQTVKHDEYMKWTEEDRLIKLGETVMYINELLNKAKKTEVHKLKGTPIEVTFDGMTLKSWRVLEEVL